MNSQIALSFLLLQIAGFYQDSYNPRLVQVSFFFFLKINKLEFMFMKHYAPNRCEPSIEALNFSGGGGGGGGGGVRADVNGEVKFL